MNRKTKKTQLRRFLIETEREETTNLRFNVCDRIANESLSCVCLGNFARSMIQQCRFKSSGRTSGKFWRFHVGAFTLRAGMIVRRTRRACTTVLPPLYLASWLRAPFTSLQAPLSVSLSLLRACPSFQPRNAPFRTITKSITFERTLKPDSRTFVYIYIYKAKIFQFIKKKKKLYLLRAIDSIYALNITNITSSNIHVCIRF